MNELLTLFDSPAVTAFMRGGGLLLSRVLPLVVLTPIFGGKAIPPSFRMLIGLVLVVGYWPALAALDPSKLTGDLYPLLILKEAVVGLTLALLVGLTMEGISAAGAVMDATRGAETGQQLNPHSGEQNSILAGLFSQLAIVLFLSLGLHRVLLDGFGRGLIALPPTELMPAWMVASPMRESLLALSGQVLVVAIQIAAPVMIVMLLTDVGLALVNRTAPQIQVFFLGMEMKSTLPLFVLFLSLSIAIGLMSSELAGLPGVIRSLFAW